MKQSCNTKRGRTIFAVATVLSALAFSSSLAMAGDSGAQVGYNSLHDNILDKGANNGRCNAIAVISSLICDAAPYPYQTVSPSLLPIIEACEGVGVPLQTSCLVVVEEPDEGVLN
jgi:hypothetical protein